MDNKFVQVPVDLWNKLVNSGNNENEVPSNNQEKPEPKTEVPSGTQKQVPNPSPETKDEQPVQQQAQPENKTEQPTAKMYTEDEVKQLLAAKQNAENIQKQANLPVGQDAQQMGNVTDKKAMLLSGNLTSKEIYDNFKKGEYKELLTS